MTARADMIAGLRTLADWLEAHPDVPAPGWVGAEFYAANDDRVTIAALAAITGVTPTTSPAGHYRVRVAMGGGVSYSAVSIPSADMAAYYRRQQLTDEQVSVALAPEPCACANLRGSDDWHGDDAFRDVVADKSTQDGTS